MSISAAGLCLVSEKGRCVRASWRMLAVFVCLVGMIFPAANPALARPLQAPAADASLAVPAEILLGEPFEFTVTFDNASPDTGYGPYLDLYLPLSGTDGTAAPGSNDGISLISAAYLTAPVETTTLNCASGASITHPLTGLAVTCPAAPAEYTGPAPFTWQLNVLRLPFGSFVGSQPPVDVTIRAQLSNLADVGTALTIQARGGFQFGADPLDNPGSDPAVIGGLTSAATTPTLLRLTKEYNGPEDETATGPNYPRQYTLVVDIADGQPITNLDVSDLLPNNLQYIRFISAVPGSCAPAEEPAAGAPQNPPANRLRVRCASITGGSGSQDVVTVFEYFVPLNDAGGAAIIDPNTGDDARSIDDARAEGDWTPVDTRDAAAHPVSDATNQDHILWDKSIAIQKSVDNLDGSPADPLDSSRPGDHLQYTLQFQISDYFAFDGLTIHDVISDGQHFDPAFTPALLINGNGYTLASAAMDPANYQETPNYTPVSPSPNDGTTALDFNISAEIIRRGQNGRMAGGCIPASGTGGPVPDCAFNDGPTTGTLVFRTVIQEQFSDSYAPNTPSVDQGDSLQNSVSISGNVLAVSNLAPTGTTEADDSGASVNILRGRIHKSIYAINGSTGYPTPVRIAAGDVVTYRIEYDLPTSDVERLYFLDYLPLPVFNIADMTATFDATVSASAPPAGSAKFGPADTFYGYSSIVPVLTTDASANSLRFFYGDFNDPRDLPTHIDLLFSVTVRSDPFADGLYLTNQARAHEGSTVTGDVDSDSIIQLQLTEPVLRIQKGVVTANGTTQIYAPTTRLPATVAISAPGSACSRLTGAVTSSNLPGTFNSNLTGPDASDLVTFAIVIENTGTGLTGAFDVRVRDTLPAGFMIPAAAPGLNLCVTDGASTPLAFTDLGGGLFGSGIELDDPAGHGSLLATDPTSGQNIVIILYDLQVDPTSTSVVPGGVLRNTATLFNYAGSEGGPDHTATDLNDDSTVTVRSPSAAKALLGTQINNAHNAANQAVIGETIDYRLTLTLPEGYLPNLRVVDTLDAGLAFVDCLNITASAGLSTSLAGGFTGACNDNANPVITGSGRTITYTLGDVANANADNSAAETITIEYRAVVLNVIGNQDGNQRRNSAVLSWNGGTLGAVRAAVVNIIEPQIAIAKTALVNGAGTSGDSGDPVTYTITLQQPAAGHADAFDLTFSDPLPSVGGGSLINDPTFTVTDNEGGVTAALFELSGSNAAGWTLRTLPGQSFDWPFSTTRRVVITINGTLSGLVDSGQTVANTAAVRWTSLDGDPGAVSPYNANSTERTGAGGVNDYAASGSANITIAAPSMTKRALATSLADSADPNVVVGEQISYQVSYTISEGMSAAFAATDQLDAGLAFLRCDNVTASAALASSTGFSCDRAVFSAFPAGSTAGQDQGRFMTLDFGNVSNSDTDNNTPETVTITYTAIVTNGPAAARGAALGNHAAGTWTSAGSSQTVQASAAPYVVTEPLLQTVKTASPLTGDGGDEIIFTVTVTNAFAANQAGAYDVWWYDTLPTGLNYAAGSLAHGSGPAPAALDDSAAPVLAARWDVLAPGQSAVITFRAVLDPGVLPNQVISNIQTITGTSLPGGNNLPVSPYNPLSCERSGEPAACGGAENDYTASAGAQVTVSGPVFAKQIRATSAPHTGGDRVAVGEIVTYALDVTLPETLNNNLQITDSLPPSLAYVSGSARLVLTGFNGLVTGLAATGGALPGDDVVIDLSDVDVFSDNDPANNRFSVLLDAVVVNDPTNQNGGTLPNSAAFALNGGSPIPAAPVNVTVVEPELQITKTAGDDTPAFGQEITYTLHIAHLTTSSADAFDLVVTDLIPTGLTYTPGSISAPAGWTADDSAAPTLTFRGDLPLSPGSVDLTYRARVAGYPQVRLLDILTNTAALTWTSLPAADLNERDGSGGVNDYTGQASETVTVSGPDLEIIKSDGDTGSQPGQGIAYTLAYRNTGNALAENVIIHETVPDYTTFDAAGSDPNWTCAPDENPGSACTLDLGTLNPGQSGSVLFSLLVDPSLPAEVTRVSNTAVISDDGTNGPDPTPENNTSSDTTPLAAAPDLVITKTDGVDVVAPGTHLTYTLTIQNAGDQDATGVEVSDTLPAGVTFVSASDGGAESAGVITWPLFDLRATQQVTRSVTVTVNDPYDGPTGLPNTATVQDDGINGSDPTPGNNDTEDEDAVATVDGNLSKTLIATNQTFTPDPNVAVGEILTYQVALTVPPGRMENVTLTDTLERGLAFDELLNLTASSPDLTSSAGTFDQILTDGQISPVPAGSTEADQQGRRMLLSLGTLTNAGAADATLTLRYTVVVLNSELNQRGLSLKNSVRWQWTGGDLANSAPPVTIVEPALGISKTVKPEVTVRNGIVTFTLKIKHTAESNSDAFDVLLTDRVPSKIKYIPGSLTWVSGQVPTSLDDTSAPVLKIHWDVFANNGQNSIIQFKARVVKLSAGDSVINTASVEWTSLPGGIRTPQSAHNDLSTERYYDPASPVNVYGSRSNAKLSIPGELPETGFAPDRVTPLPVQPAEKRYQGLGDIWLEIPSQGVKLSVVGIPAVDGGWDLSWLGNQAGYLDGSAFPGLEGNTVLTGHVYDANGQPGPFASLSNLKWGDTLLLHVYGQTYRYEIRQMQRQLSPQDLSPLQHEEYSWLTLLTCEGYQPDSQSYRWRLAVRAVLIRIDS